MAFIRCDLGSVPRTTTRSRWPFSRRPVYLHSAYQVTDLDEVAAAGEYLRERGYRHAWGIGRHIQGSQIFDYWRDPDRLMFEHYTDGDVFDCSMRARLGADVGQRPGAVGAEGDRASSPAPATRAWCVAAIKALTDKGNEVDFAALRGLIKAMGS